MERSLYITDYRNIGLKNAQRLVLNNFSNKDNVGNLVILIGPNNSGKSNVLDALSAFGQNKITERDVTTLSYEEDHLRPQLSLCCKDGDKEFTYRVTYKDDKSPYIYYSKEEEGEEEEEVIDMQEMRSVFTDLIKIFENKIKSWTYQFYSIFNSDDVTDFCDEVRRALDEEVSSLSEYIKSGIELGQDILRSSNSHLRACWNEFVRQNKHSTFVKMCVDKCAEKREKLNYKCNTLYGINFLPKIIRYEANGYKNTDFITDINNICKNRFFVSLFKIIGYDVDKLKRVYTVYNNTHNGGIFATQENEINKLLEKTSEKFNSMYRMGDERYSFKIRLETGKIIFAIYNGGKDASYDYQSTGFRWFFNLYFNLLGGQMLDRGDIILMDEPATNLHILGQRELRKFLKSFAQNNGLTIVLATHSPFLIDVDYLDEVRVIESHDGESCINNSFYAVNGGDADCLMSVKNALTINSCQLYDPDKTVVFVEGITDYNYLLAFKKALDISDEIVFLPINGLGDQKCGDIKKQQKAISKQLITLRKSNPILLVDGDGAGQSMKEVNKQSELNVVLLSEIDPKFKNIEDLFDDADLKNLGLKDANGAIIKHGTTSAEVKTYADKYEFSETTLKNFKRLFEKIKQLVE